MEIDHVEEKNDFEFVDARPDVLQLNACVSLVEQNMKSLYQAAGWGWSSSRKRKELSHRDAEFVLVLNEQKRVIAFSNHRRETCDDGSTLLYLYELQVDSSAQRRGIGAQLLSRLLRRADEVRFTPLAVQLNRSCGQLQARVMLTCFRENRRARAFYERQNFTLDASDRSYATR